MKPADPAITLRAAVDELAVRNLVARLAQAADDRDEAAYRRCFARNVTTETGPGERHRVSAADYAAGFDGAARSCRLDPSQALERCHPDRCWRTPRVGIGRCGRRRRAHRCWRPAAATSLSAAATSLASSISTMAGASTGELQIGDTVMVTSKAGPCLRRATSLKTLSRKDKLMMKFDQIYVDGGFRVAEGREELQLYNPATEQPSAIQVLADQRDAARAVESAARAFPSFSRSTKAQRIDLLTCVGRCRRGTRGRSDRGHHRGIWRTRRAGALAGRPRGGQLPRRGEAARRLPLLAPRSAKPKWSRRP